MHEYQGTTCDLCVSAMQLQVCCNICEGFEDERVREGVCVCVCVCVCACVCERERETDRERERESERERERDRVPLARAGFGGRLFLVVLFRLLPFFFHLIVCD